MNLINVILFSLAATGLAVGCASKLQKVEIPATANPTEEVSSFEADLKKAEQAQVDVFSPKNFVKAEEYMKDAKASREKNKPEKALEQVCYGRAYLNTANARAKAAMEAYPEITSSRREALASGAQSTDSKKFRATDSDLKSEVKKFEDKMARMDVKDRDSLNKQYLDLELNAIKAAYLGSAKNNLEAAEKAGAKKASPQTYESALAKITAAERAIETDRHDNAAIGRISAEALAETQKLQSITGLVKNAKKKSPEEIALEMNANKNRLDQANSQTAAKDRELNKQNASLVAISNQNEKITDENTKLASREKFNQTFDQAQKKFSPKEAEVYRQGPNLLIRLKSMNFKSGQAELSGNSLSLLGKVKSVIQDMGAHKVIVEGHTDSIGTKAVNEKVSKERATTVANYLVSEKILASSEVESEGFGFEKPIASNKTKEGRAQNRRVDIIITPAAESAQ